MKTLLVTLAMAAFNCSLFAQTGPADNIVSDYAKHAHFNGVVLVATHGTIDFCKAVGIADRQKNRLLTTQSIFRIASMTKVFTAVLVMKLVEEKKLALDKTIGIYFPAYKGEGRDKVTIHDLLTYASGIGNIAGTLGMQPYQKNIALDSFITAYCSGKLVYEPGTKSEYSNTEYILLHKIIEQASGARYDEYLHKVILDPLNMTHTGVYHSAKTPRKLSQSYTYDDSLKTFTPDQKYYPEMYFGAGFLYSTAEDLLKFDQAIFNHTLLKKETTDQLLSIHPDRGNTAYGFWGSPGWGNFAEKFYYRTGGILGSTSNWIHTMDSEKTIIVLSNTDGVNLYELSEKFYMTNK